MYPGSIDARVRWLLKQEWTNLLWSMVLLVGFFLETGETHMGTAGELLVDWPWYEGYAALFISCLALAERPIRNGVLVTTILVFAVIIAAATVVSGDVWVAPILVPFTWGRIRAYFYEATEQERFDQLFGGLLAFPILLFIAFILGLFLVAAAGQPLIASAEFSDLEAIERLQFRDAILATGAIYYALWPAMTWWQVVRGRAAGSNDPPAAPLQVRQE